jgi:hypothetical protein
LKKKECLSGTHPSKAICTSKLMSIFLSLLLKNLMSWKNFSAKRGETDHDIKLNIYFNNKIG